MANLDEVMKKLNKSKQEETPKKEEDLENVEDPAKEDAKDVDEEDLDSELENEIEEENKQETENIDEEKKIEIEEIKEQEKIIAKQREKEVEILQNDGIFREELLVQLAQINQNLHVLNTLISKAMGDENGGSKKE